jgi:predicted HTH transcriptional regulator
MVLKQTSLDAFNEIKATLGERQRVVYGAIKLNPDCTDYEIAEFLGSTDPNTVRPRRKELYDKGMIYETGVRECKVTGHKATTWTAV